MVVQFLSIHLLMEGDSCAITTMTHHCWISFVVDFSALGTNTLISSKWPPDDYTRTYMASRVTNVVFDTKGIVRLPNYAELQEVSSYLISTTPTSIKAGYFELFNFWTKENLLLDLATNRQSVWPMKK
jgi:hypothetical protein